MNYIFGQETYQKINFAEVSCFSFADNYIHYHIQDQVAFVPFKSSFSWARTFPTQDFLKAFVSHLGLNCKQIKWVLPPNIYTGSRDLLLLLLQLGFKIERVELNQHLPLNAPLKEIWHTDKLRRVRSLKRLGASTEQLPISFLDQCYNIIETNRSRKGRTVTMQKADLERLIRAFPDSFLLYGTYLNQTLCACSVTIKVSETIIYQFYWAHLAQFDDKSPLLYHNHWLAGKAKEEGLELIDFGVSSVKGIINRGLHRYKKDMGARISRKYYLSLNF
jgi:hypothetical protein